MNTNKLFARALINVVGSLVLMFLVTESGFIGFSAGLGPRYPPQPSARCCATTRRDTRAWAALALHAQMHPYPAINLRLSPGSEQSRGRGTLAA